MGSSRSMIVLSLCVVVFGCGKGDEPGGGGGGGKDAAAAPAPTALADAAAAVAAPTADAAAAAPSPLDALPKLEELPPLDLAPRPRKEMDASAKLNTAALKLHRAKAYPEAIAAYQKAIAADPGNLVARYNLACAWNMSGDAPRGLATLQQLKANGCRACLARLIHSRTDKEWDNQRQNPVYDLITKDVVVEPTDVARVAEQIARFDGKLDGLEPYLHPRSPVKFVVSGNTEETTIGLAGLQAFEDKAKKGGRPWMREQGKQTCKESCCTYEKPNESPDSNTWDLTRLCFEGAGGVSFLSKLEFDEYGYFLVEEHRPGIDD